MNNSEKPQGQLVEFPNELKKHIQAEAKRVGVDVTDFLTSGTPLLEEIDAINQKYDLRLQKFGDLADDKEFVAEVEMLRSNRLNEKATEMIELFAKTREKTQATVGHVNE